MVGSVELTALSQRAAERGGASTGRFSLEFRRLKGSIHGLPVEPQELNKIVIDILQACTYHPHRSPTPVQWGHVGVGPAGPKRKQGARICSNSRWILNSLGCLDQWRREVFSALKIQQESKPQCLWHPKTGGSSAAF